MFEWMLAWIVATVAYAIQPEAKTPQEAVEAWRPRVVLVEMERAGQPYSATGFLWESPDRVITAYHAVAGADAIWVSRDAAPRQAARPAQVSRVNVGFDVAELRLVRHDDPAVPPSSHPMNVDPAALRAEISDGLAKGGTVHSLGHTVGRREAAWEKHTLRHALDNLPQFQDILNPKAKALFKDAGFPALGGRFVDLAGSLSHGDSGAPVFDAEGRLVGIAGGGLVDNKVWAAPASALASLEPIGGTPPPVPSHELLHSYAFAMDSEGGLHAETLDAQEAWEADPSLETLTGLITAFAAADDDPQRRQDFDLLHDQLKKITGRGFKNRAEAEGWNQGAALGGEIDPETRKWKFVSRRR